MKFTIAGIGKIQKKWIKEGIQEYQKRMTPVVKVQILEQEEEKMPPHGSEAMKESILQKEGQKILKYVHSTDCVILLDVAGKEMSSPALAKWLEEQMNGGNSSFVFLLGGPFGNGKNLKERADFMLSLSPMTFPHQLARLILMEQLYRAVKIIRNEPYHL